MTLHIRYHSVYGSTKQYAEALAQQLQVTAAPLDVPVPDDGAPVVLLSPVHGPNIPAVSAAKTLEAHPIAVVAVGMTLLEDARRKDAMRKMLPADVERFYLPGRMDFAGLSTAHKATMLSIIAFIKAKPMKTKNDVALIATHNAYIDRVDFTELQPIIAWVRQHAL